MKEERGGFGGVVKQEGLGPWGEMRRAWGRGMRKDVGTLRRGREELGAREERSEQPSPAQRPTRAALPCPPKLHSTWPDFTCPPLLSAFGVTPSQLQGLRR